MLLCANFTRRALLFRSAFVRHSSHRASHNEGDATGLAPTGRALASLFFFLFSLPVEEPKKFPDCNQYLCKNLCKVPHQGTPEASEIWKKHALARLTKTSLFPERTFQQMCLKRPSTKDTLRDNSGPTFKTCFGPGWPVSPRPQKTSFAIPFDC